jgi:hypothetical protein
VLERVTVQRTAENPRRSTILESSPRDSPGEA